MIRQLKKSYFLVPLLLGFSGCSDFLDVNVTPNNPTTVTPAVLLPTVEAATAFANANELNRFASVIVQQLAGAAPNSTPGQTDIYETTGSDFGNQWRFELYGGALINAQKLIELGEANNGRAYAGIGKILKAYGFSIATDVWGDVPYSEALQGEDIPQPRLDSQEDIYKGNTAAGIQSLFDLVREGLSDLEANSVITPGKEDLAYAGDLNKWKQAGNTLLLKFANTISRKEPELARTVINEVLTRGTYIKSNADDLNMPFGGSVGSQDPRYFYTNQSSFKDDLIMSTRYLNRLRALNDPRLPIFFTKPGADYITIENGFRGTVPQPSDNWSRYNAYVTGVNGEGPVRLLTNFQRAFILAESALTLGTPGDPQALYTEGITASMTSAGLTQAEITTYLAANPAVATLTGTTEQKLEQIITQKYIAFTGNGLEIWNDVRRTGYPRLPASLNAAGIDGTPQVRAVYVTQEQERNPAFPTPGPQTNVRVWWDID